MTQPAKTATIKAIKMLWGLMKTSTSSDAIPEIAADRRGKQKKVAMSEGTAAIRPAKQAELGQVGANGLFPGCPKADEDGHAKGPLRQKEWKR